MPRLAKVDPDIVVIDLENPSRDLLEQMVQVRGPSSGRWRCSSTTRTRR